MRVGEDRRLGAGKPLADRTRSRRSAGALAVIVMENEEFGDILGSSSTPYINGLARRYSLAQQMYAIGHPSLPNYLALTGGSTHGISSDCTGCSVPGTGLAGQLALAAHHLEGLHGGPPRPCFQGAGAGDYAKKHDPFVYYRGVVSDPALCDERGPAHAARRR